jgi:ATP-dependent RNA helicase HelY
MRAAGQAERLERELVELTGRVDGHNRSLARDFDRVIDVLSRRGYVEVHPAVGGNGDDEADWRLTPAGRVLARVFHESDLLVAECLHNGLLDGLDAASLAGLVSTFVYEHRSPEPAPPPWFPSADVGKRWRKILATSDDLAADERATGLAEHRPPDAGFAAAAYAWVAGEGLAEVVEGEELAGGDFVRTMKQLVDLARQLATVAPDPETRARSREVGELAFRGVVADVVVSGGDIAAEEEP